jgi:hypothetical protein
MEYSNTDIAEQVPMDLERRVLSVELWENSTDLNLHLWEKAA